MRILRCEKKSNIDPTLAIFPQDIHGIYVSHGVEMTLEEVQEMVRAGKDGHLTEKEFVQRGAERCGAEVMIQLPNKNFLCTREISSRL